MSRPIRRAGAAIGATACTALVAAALLGCGGDERSPEAYCRAFYTKAAPIRQGYIDANKNVEQNPLDAIVKVLSAPGDMVVIFDGMVDHAPDDIRSDTEEVRESFKKMQESMGDAVSDPLGALGGGIIRSLSSAGSYERVDAYLNQHCPVDSPLAQKIIRGEE
jgi:hypothetical protein